jgi:NAD(P)H dehydrogenase (quinone)
MILVAGIDAATAAGIEHVVKVSASCTGPRHSMPFRTHARVEEYLAHSGITATILRPNAVMQNLLNGNAAFLGRHGNADAFGGNLGAVNEVRFRECIQENAIASGANLGRADTVRNAL